MVNMEYRNRREIPFSKCLVSLLMLMNLCASTSGQTGLLYRSWLVGNTDIENLQVFPKSNETENTDFLLQIPLNIEITDTDSGADNCNPGIEYCAPSANRSFPDDYFDSDCSAGSVSCSYPECTFTAQKLPLDAYAFDFEYFVDVGEIVPFDSSLEECGLLLQEKDIRFVNKTGECAVSSKQPYVNLVIQDPEIVGSYFNYTLSFRMDMPVENFPVTVLNISGAPGNFERIISETILVVSSPGNITLTPFVTYSLRKFNREITGSSRVNITVQFIQDRIIIYLDGEIAFIMGPSLNNEGPPPPTNFLVGFGSEKYKGLLSDVKFYNVSATTNEIYSKYSGLPLAKALYRPECTCPREYTDSFNLNSVPQFDNRCSGFVSPSQPAFRVGNGRNTDHGKWSIFNDFGWMSDITDKATITLTLSQQMFFYSVSGEFTDVQHELGKDIKRPSTMEIEILESPGFSRGAVVYVSDDCMEDYGLTPYRMPRLFMEESNLEFNPGSFSELGPQRRRRDADVEVSTKCFLWEDVITGQTGQNTQWQIPIFTPKDIGNVLSDEFSGTQIAIALNGHYDNIVEYQGENWYNMNKLQLYIRPNCGGHPFKKLPRPTDISSYYEFIQPGHKAFECLCPEGIGGDQCEECTEVEGLFRYTKRPGVCADCGCSKLVTSKQCNKATGQCPCVEGGDEDLAGRQCHWYIEGVEPHYGPVAGGTHVTISGGYFNMGLVSVSIDAVEQNISLAGNLVELETTLYRGQDTKGETKTVDLAAQLDFDGDAGPTVIYRNFKYRPNPIIEAIFPRTSILSGGTYLTVTGEFLNSVAYPEMIIYLRQRNVLIDTIISVCDVKSETEMTCRIKDLSAAEPYLRGYEVAVNGNNGDTTSLDSTTVNGENGGTTALDSTTVNGENGGTTALDSTTGGGMARRRRQASNDENEGIDTISALVSALNGRQGVNFTLGFAFDGHDVFEDLRKNPDPELRELSTLFVYDNPKVFPFKVSLGEEVLEYTAGELIKLEGEQLDKATKREDYIVTIGVDSVCEVTDLTSNQLTCRPPKESPEPSESNFENHKNRKIPHVQVEVGNVDISVGYVYYKTNIWVDNDAFRISMIVLIVLVVVILLAVLGYCLAKKFLNVKSYEIKTLEDAEYPSARYVKRGSTTEKEGLMPLFGNRKLDPDIQAKVNRCKIPPERLQTGKPVGKGNFGLVFKGQLITPAGNLKTVAVKTIKEDKEMSFEDLENFLAEGTLMIDFKHENVLSLVGVVFQGNDRPQVVLPYMENGDLCNFVKKGDLEIVLADLLHFAYQMANGMAYLAKERFVHRDLAARNCMVDGSYVVKIADFGMSRDIYEQDYYKMENMNKPLPMKWMAVESLKEGRYTSKSDVWSYGITMWELLTRGSTPYPGVNNYYIKEYVSTGKRLDRPEICPPIIYEMMCRCWENDPEDRPSFSEISTFVEMLLSGKNKPDATSDADAGYSYARKATKDIPDDYLDSTGYADNLEGDDYYITPMSSASEPPADPTAPTPSPRVTLDSGAITDPEHVYINTEPSMA